MGDTLKKNIFLAMCLVVLCSACTTITEITDSPTYKDTKRFYFKHVNKPAVVDFQDVAEVGEMEEKITVSFARLDSELTNLLREMDSILDISNQVAVTNLFTKFPWISHIYALDPYGDVQGAIPSFIPEYIDFSFIDDREVKTREIYANIQEIPGGGHEILVLRPYMQSGELLGYLAVSFDPKVLLPFVGDASNVLLLGVNQVLWTGNHLYSETPFDLKDWQAEINSKSFGHVENDKYKGAWLVRYLGGATLIYGVIEERGN